MGVLDVVSLAILAILLVGVLFLILIVAAIPGVLAKKRHSPWAEAINVAGWVGVLLAPIWMLALIAAFVRPQTGALKSPEDALNLAVVKYKIGQTDLSPVLELENLVSATQMANTSYVQHELLANRINLYLALGGAF